MDSAAGPRGHTQRSPVAHAAGERSIRPGGDEPGHSPGNLVGGADPAEEWTSEELAALRAELVADAHRLRAEMAQSAAAIAELADDGLGDVGADPADTGGRTSGREHEMVLADVHRVALEQTEKAVQRIDDGTYGRCESCQGPVGKARLLAFPRATLCLRCKQKQERR